MSNNLSEQNAICFDCKGIFKKTEMEWGSTSNQHKEEFDYVCHKCWDERLEKCINQDKFPMPLKNN